MEDRATKEQTMLPKAFRTLILKTAHEILLASHLGVNKYRKGITSIRMSAYHPQSQGVLEQFHLMLKSIRAYCMENHREMDEGFPFVMFAEREARQESLGFTHFELVYGHAVRGPLKLMKERCLQGNPDQMNLLDYVTHFRNQISEVSKLARKHLELAQDGKALCSSKRI